MALTAEEIEQREKTRPRSYDLSNPDELDRLLRETIGYAVVSLLKRDGTDWEGRQYACDALKRDGTDWEGRQYACDALKRAVKMGFKLRPAE